MNRAISILAAVLLSASPVSGQDMPADYKQVLDTLAKAGDFKDNVLKVNIPRNDIAVVVAGVKTPTPFGFGGWVAMTKGDGGQDVMMGDLVLLQDEVNPVMSALLNNGLEVTALHNHFYWDEPRMAYMHVHGHGSAVELAKRLKPVLALIGKAQTTTSASGRAIDGKLDTEAIAKLIGFPGEQSGAVFKITIGRRDLTIREMGAIVNTRMGLNTWAAFYGSDVDAVVAGDVAMLDGEVTSILKAIRANGLEVVAMHHHMIGTEPNITFLHYWGKGSAMNLAKGVRAALDQLPK